MARVGTPAAESFFATLQTELLNRCSWTTRQALQSAIFGYIEGFYNRQRRHSTLGYLSPIWNAIKSEAFLGEPGEWRRFGAPGIIGLFVTIWFLSPLVSLAIANDTFAQLDVSILVGISGVILIPSPP